MSLQEAVAAPLEVEIGNFKETLYPLRFIEWGKIEQWMRGCIIKAAANSLEGLTPAASRIVMQAAAHTASQINIMSCLQGDANPETSAFLQTLEGMLWVLRESLRSSTDRNATYLFSLAELDEKINCNLLLVQKLYLSVIDISFPMAVKIGEALQKKEQDSETEVPNG